MAPNILFVFADQLRYDALGCSGNPVVKTPHIDRLAREGVVFDHAITSSPVCGPYRGQLLTGCYSHTNGVVCNEYRIRDGLVTLPQILRSGNYRSAYVGKLHLGEGPYIGETGRLGFDDLLAYNNGHEYYKMKYYHNEEGPFPVSEYAPFREVELAIETMERYRQETPDQPFCVCLSWGPPHWSGSTGEERDYGDYPEEYDTYDPASMPVPDNVPAMLRLYEQREFADYYAMITSLDDCMGRLMEALDTMGLSDNTVLCFSSDHGDHLGAHGYGKANVPWLPDALCPSKMTCYEESVHVPLIVRYPNRVSPSRRTDLIFNSVDILPTLCGLGGVEVPENVQGTDLSFEILGEEGEAPDSAYLQILGPGWPTRRDFGGLWRGVRTARYTYARYAYPEPRQMLFDRETDPLEMTNLADDPTHADLLQGMEEKLQEWIRKTDDPFDSGVRLPDNGMLDLNQEFIKDEWYDLAPPDYASRIRPYRNTPAPSSHPTERSTPDA